MVDVVVIGWAILENVAPVLSALEAAKQCQRNRDAGRLTSAAGSEHVASA